MTSNCQHCGAAFAAKRSTARFCSDRCRIGAHRNEPRPLASVWFRKAAYALAREVFAPRGVEVDAGRIDVSFGYPVSGTGHTVGGASVGASFIVITPHHNPGFVLEVLTHEMVHVAALGDGHGSEFRRIAAAVGLDPPWRATRASPELVGKLRAIVTQLGPMPAPVAPPSREIRAFVGDGRGGFVLNPQADMWLPDRRAHRRR